jgi:hypothetical protein
MKIPLTPEIDNKFKKVSEKYGLMMISMEIKFSLQIEVITIFGKKKIRSITYKNIMYDVFI